MKRKYFLRGLGAGIVLSAVVMGVTSSKSDLTDAEIRKKAVDLGMIEKPDALESMLKETKTPETSEPVADADTENASDTKQPVETKAVSQSTEPPEATARPAGKSGNTGNNAKPAATRKPAATSVPKATSKPIVTSKPVTQPKKTQREILRVSIEAGMWSEEISQRFKELGLVDNAKKFDDFLCDNNYASDIHVGEYNIPKGSTYEQIAKIITN